MTITEHLIKLLPAKVVRKNKCYNLVFIKDAATGDDNIKVGYRRVDSRGKEEILTVVEGSVNGSGLRDTLITTIKNLISDGFSAMGYQTAQA